MGSCTTTNVVPGCFNGTPVLIHVTDDGLGAPATRIIDVAGNIVAGADATNTTPGVCPAVAATARIVPEGANIASGIYDPDYTPQGSAASWVFPGSNLQSVTVTALKASTPGSGNTVRVVFPSGRTVYLVEGQTVGWSVAQDSGDIAELLDTGLTVECLGNSAATVIWTEQV